MVMSMILASARRGSVRLCGWTAALALVVASTCRAAPAGGGAAGVTMSTQGGNVMLNNGIVQVTIDSASAEISSIRFNGHEMVNTGRGHNHIYFSRDGGGDYERLGHCVGSVASQDADGIDYCCKHIYSAARGDKHAWDVEVHFVLRRGVSGIYVAANASHPADYAALGIGEFRMVWSTPGGADELNQIYIDNARHWRIPLFDELSKAIPVPGGPKEVTELTSGDWKGRYDCKYMYAGQYWDLKCWGFASDVKKRGAWVVLPSREFFNDGPNKQDLTGAVGTTLLHWNMNHYDGTGISLQRGQAWEKFYGPVLLYVNDGASGDACWQDAQARGDAEAAQWPYAWMKHANYPQAATRGTVHGTFAISDALKPSLTAAGAWIGLAQAENGPKSDFQFQASGYQFWTHVAADGTFTIPAVRPGEYAIYAFATGAVGQFTKADIRVTAGNATDVGTLTWKVPHRGSRIAWEIGTPDRSAAEFGHGRDYFLPMLFAKLPAEVPEPLDYTVGQSDPARDWYYAQTRHANGGNFEQQHWRIHFKLGPVPAGEATLTLAFAGADRARIGVAVNDGKGHAVVPPVQGGNGLVREAVHTKYSVVDVAIPASELHAGENTITLTQDSVRDAASYVMYDYLSLELP